MSAGGCIPLTRSALGQIRAMGPYGFIVYGTLLRLAPGYEVMFTCNHGELVEMTGTSYKTVKHAIGVLTDLGLASFAGRKLNAADSAGMVVVLHREGCGKRCELMACAQPVDNPVDNSSVNPLLKEILESAVSHGATALPMGLARAKGNAQVKAPAVAPGATAGKSGGGMNLSLYPELERKEEVPVEGGDDPRIMEVFGAWVGYNFEGKHLIQHQAITPLMLKRIVKALKNLDKSREPNDSLIEIKHAIANYGRCLLDPECACSYSWTLADFLGRENGLERYFDEADSVEREKALKKSRSEYSGRGKSNATNPNGFKSARKDPFANL